MSSLSIAGGTTGNNQENELHDAVYVVGALDELITLRGMNFHPIDIENSVMRCHKKIAERYIFSYIIFFNLNLIGWLKSLIKTCSNPLG